jgi:hypothetical protein
MRDRITPLKRLTGARAAPDPLRDPSRSVRRGAELIATRGPLLSALASQAEEDGREGEGDDGDAEQESPSEAADQRPADGGGDRGDGGKPEGVA